MPDIRSHRRVLDTFTGPVERPVLRWLAAHMPPWMTPDILTGIGVVGGIIIFTSYALSGLSPIFLWLASLGFVINWFGDSLDGTLARYRKIERPVYGFYIDHAVDAYIELMIFLGLGLSPYVRFDLACLALIGYLLLSVLVFIRTCVKGEFTLSYGRLGPTEARLIAISANTLVYFIGNPFITVGPWTLTVYDWIAVFVILLLLGIAIFTTARQARLLAEQDLKARLEKAAPAQNVPSSGKISHN
jgi:phosphatidylglycerophosphate synthase